MSAAQNVARAAARYVEDAVGEMGYDKWVQDEHSEKIAAAKKQGVRDIGGWLADEFYNDAGVVEDLAGDRMYDLMRQHGLNPNRKEDWDACVTEFKALVPHVASKINLSF